MSNVFSGLGDFVMDGLKSMLGGTSGAGGNQYMVKGANGIYNSGIGINKNTPGAILGVENGAFTADGLKSGADNIKSMQGNISESTPFDFGTSINNLSKVGNMYSAYQDQKMKGQYFDEWKKNNAYMKEEAEAQKKGRQGLARSLAR